MRWCVVAAAMLAGVAWLQARVPIPAPLAAAEILLPATSVTNHEWSEEVSSFSGGRVLAWDEVPAQVYASVVEGRNALRRKADAGWFNGGRSLGGPGIEAQGGYRVAFEWEFDLTSDAFEVWIVGRERCHYGVLVDGALVGSGDAREGVAQGGSIGFQKFRFGSWSTRRITLLSNEYLGGIALPAGAEVAAPPRRPRQRCVVLGDSITEAFQFPLGPIIGGWAQRLRHHFGWEVIASGSGGTGYVCTRGGQVPLRLRLGSDCYAYQPDIVIVALGLNDPVATAAERTATAEEAARCFADLKAHLPRARIVVLSPFYPTTPPATYLDLGTRLRAQASAAGCEYVDVLGWFTAENRAPYFTIPNDATHPGPEGHAYLAARLAQELYQLGLGRDAATAQLVNLSVRAVVGPGNESLMVGFVLGGQAPKQVLVRGIGPTLAAFGVAGVLADPRLTLYGAGAEVRGENDNWGSQPNRAQVASVASRLGAFPLAPEAKDAALLPILEPGAYTVQLRASEAAPGGGAALVEIYELP